MKNIKLKLVTFVVTISALVGCNRVMDTNSMETYDEKMIWSTRATANSFVLDVYNNVLPKYYGGNTVTWECRTPNMIAKLMDGNNNNPFNTDNIEPGNDFGFFGGYGTIRKINMIIAKSQEYAGKGLDETDVKELVAEGKLLRAMYYYPQARGVGRVMWIDKVFVPADTVGDALRKIPLTASVSETYSLIIKDLDDAIAGMGTSKTPGKLNKWAAYAIMSDVCLQAAAYETNTAKRSELLKKCIDAVNTLETQGGYSLVSNYGDMFNEKNSNANAEIIMAVYKSSTTGFTCGSTDMQTLVPNVNNDRLGKSGSSPAFKRDLVFEAWGTRYPTHNMADAYLVIDKANPSKAVKWNESSQFMQAVEPESYKESPAWGTDEKLSTMQIGDVLIAGKAKTPGQDVSSIIYGNRDARFYANLVYDNSEFFNEPVYFRFRGNFNRYASDNNLQHYMTLTNYVLRKGMYNNPEGGRVYVSNKTDYHWVVCRLGRAILNKAEAQLWLAGMGEGSFADAVTTFNKTRVTHGQLPASTAASSAEAWNDYITERRADLAYENDFYWSALRWGLHGGDANKGIPAKGKAAYLLEEPTFIEFSPKADAFFVSTLTYWDINKRAFREDRRYLLPIPKGELDANPNLGVQNPGW